MFIAAVAALALASSWVSVFNGFTYDDRFIVLNNVAVHDLRNWYRFFAMPYWPQQWGGEGYRPLSILFYSLEWAAGRGAPWVFHAVNVTLYAGVTVAVFVLAEACLPVAAAWVAAALYAVHPVHVEAVANVVGQSELLAAICMLLALIVYVRRRNELTLGAGSMVAIGVLYALGCLAKEHAIMLPALLLLAELVMVTDRAPLTTRLAARRPLALGLALVAASYLAAHMAVSAQTITGFQAYQPFALLHVGTSGRVFTMIGVAPELFRLVLWPMRLSPEYGPPANPVVDGFQAYQLPGMIVVAGTLLLAIAAWKRQPAIAFGIWFAAIALLPASNLLFPAAGFFSERTLFMPSVGVVIAVGALVPWAHQRLHATAARTLAAAALATLIALAAMRSSARSRVWKDNDTLFSQAVIDAPDVYRSHFMLGSIRFNEGRKVDGEREYETAIRLYDRDPSVFYLLGEEYRAGGLNQAAADMYRRSLAVDSTLALARARLALVYAELGRWEDADREAKRTLAANTDNAAAMLAIVRLAGAARRFPVNLREHPLPPLTPVQSGWSR